MKVWFMVSCLCLFVVLLCFLFAYTFVFVISVSCIVLLIYLLFVFCYLLLCFFLSFIYLYFCLLACFCHPQLLQCRRGLFLPDTGSPASTLRSRSFSHLRHLQPFLWLWSTRNSCMAFDVLLNFNCPGMHFWSRMDSHGGICS